MITLRYLFTTSDITVPTVAIRLVACMVMSGLLGFERAVKGHAAGLRTHILIAIGAALFMLLSIETARFFSGSGGPVFDPGRIAAQVVSGIGFLGAGAIMRHGPTIKGLTTAADIWVVAAIGLACGAGFFLHAVLVSAVALFVLVALGKLEKRLIPESTSDYVIIYLTKGLKDLSAVRAVLGKFNISTLTLSVTSDKRHGVLVKAGAKLPRPLDIEDLTDKLNKIDSVRKILLRIRQDV